MQLQKKIYPTSLVNNWELKKSDNAKILLFALLLVGGQLLKWGPG